MSEDLAVEALLEFLNAAEAGISSAKQLIEREKVGEWDPGKVQWSAAEGPKGPYEKATQQESSDYQALVRDLRAHDGNLTRDPHYYWLFQDSTTVGRKKRS